MLKLLLSDMGNNMLKHFMRKIKSFCILPLKMASLKIAYLLDGAGRKKNN